MSDPGSTVPPSERSDGLVTQVRSARKRGDSEFLIWALTANDEHARWLAARSLGELGDVSAVNALVGGALHSSDEIFQAHCLKALERIGDQRAVPALREIAERSRAFGVRTSAVRALLVMGDRQAIGVLAEILLDPDIANTYSRSTRPAISARTAKRWAAEQLRNFCGVEALSQLIGLPSGLSLSDRLLIRRVVRVLKRRV